MANAVDCTSRPCPLYEVLALWGNVVGGNGKYVGV